MFHHEVHYKSATIDCNRVFSLRNGIWKFFFIYFHLGSRASLGYTTLPFFLSPLFPSLLSHILLEHSASNCAKCLEKKEMQSLLSFKK